MSDLSRLLNSASFIAVSLCIALTFAPATVHAQSPASPGAQVLEEVIVTAEHRAGNVQKVGAAVSVRSGNDLQEQGKFTLESILQDVPGLGGGAADSAVSSGRTGTDSPAAGLVIRGIPSNGGAGGSTTTASPAAAIYVDGVYSGLGGGYDIDRVEVLRGPQGTLYGRSATTGVVAIHTRSPDLNSFGGEVTLERGNYALQHYSGALNVPIIADKLAVRASGNFFERDGYISGKTDYRGQDGRIKLLFKPSDNVSLLVGAALQDNTLYNGGRSLAATANLGVVGYTTVKEGEIGTKFRQYWSELNIDLGPASLTYLPAFRSYTQNGVLYLSSPLGVISQPVSTPKDEFITHEVRLASNAESKLFWQLGAIYYNNVLQSRNTTNVNNVEAFTLIEDRETTAYGVYAEATYPFTDSLRFTAGLRYDQTKVETSPTYRTGPFSPTYPKPDFTLPAGQRVREFKNWNYKLRAEADLTPSNLLYASVSTGSSPGDIVVSGGCPASVSATPPCALLLDSETLTNYEVGSKNRFLGNTMQVNGDLFYSDYEGFQSAAVRVSTGGAPQFAALASPLKSYGVELEAQYNFTPADRLDLNFSYQKTRYVDKPAYFAKFVAEDSVTDNGNPGGVGPVPMKASLAYEHAFKLAGDSMLKLRTDAVYTSSHEGHFTAQAKADGQAQFVEIDSAVIGNFNATLMINDKLSVSGYVRNVFDHQYFQKITLDNSKYPIYLYQPTYNDPRTFGVVLNAKF